MPIYEYECTECGELIEKIQRHSDPPLETCDACGGAVRKRISPPAIQFKGSGWYITDYSDKGKKAAKEGKKEAQGSSGGESKKTSSSEASGSKSSASGD